MNKQERDELVVKYLPVARRVAAELTPSIHKDVYEDYVQIAWMGILEAARRYDPERATSFASFAIPYAKYTVYNFIRDHGSLLKIARGLRQTQLAEGVNINVNYFSEPFIADTHRVDWITFEDRACYIQDDPDDFAEADRKMDCQAMFTKLKGLERQCLEMRYQQAMAQREVARELGISQMQVSRLTRSAMMKLRAYMNGDEIPTYKEAVKLAEDEGFTTGHISYAA